MKFTYGRNFWILSFSMFLFMTSFNLILPELNDYITLLDGADYKGLIFLFFSISAAIVRPFAGKLSDTIGRKKVMIFGMIVGAITCLLYPLFYTVSLFLILRLIHGFSAGLLPTGATALATDILPANKRGQGMGIWGVFISLGFGVGQSLGSIINNAVGINNLFLISSGVAILSGILLTGITETLPEESRQPFSFSLLRIKFTDIFEPSVLPAALVMFLSAICTGMVFVLTPDLASFIGIENKGAFFTFYAISTIAVRLFTSSLSDNIGRRKTLLIGMLILIVSIVLLAYAQTVFYFALAGTVFGIATGVSSPTFFAWMADMVPDTRRGVGSGTMFIALEVGIMVGSGITLIMYDNTLATILPTLLVGACSAIFAASYLVWHLMRRESVT